MDIPVPSALNAVTIQSQGMLLGYIWLVSFFEAEARSLFFHVECGCGGGMVGVGGSRSRRVGGGPEEKKKNTSSSVVEGRGGDCKIANTNQCLSHGVGVIIINI